MRPSSPDQIVASTVQAAQAVFGVDLEAIYCLGSLAHGGFAPLVSDVDIAVILSSTGADTADRIARVEAMVLEATNGPLAQRLSLFWADWHAVRTGEGDDHRLGPVDRLDLLDSGRLVIGRDGREPSRRPSGRDLTVMSADHILRRYTDAYLFAESGIDIDRLSRLVDTMVASGVHAIAPLGSTGESAYLSLEEWKTVVDATVRAVAGRVPVVVGSSDLTTSGTVARAEYAQSAGASAVMVIPVSYWALNEREISQHYRAVSDAISIPIMAYNNPATSGIDMSPKLLTHMFETITNVTMVKESTGEIQRMLDIKEFSAGELPFYNGSNPLVLKALLAGARGWCTAAPCLRPAPTIALYEAVSTGDTERATEIYEDLLPLLSFIVTKGLPTAVKSGLEILGEPAGVPRLPLLPLEPEDRAYLDSLLSPAIA